MLLIAYVMDRKGHELHTINRPKNHNKLGWLTGTELTDGIRKTTRE